MAIADDLVTIFGLPAHPLLVHAVVVLLPLSAAGAIAVAVRPAWRARFGWPVLALTAAAVGAVPMAQAAGEQLDAALGTPQDPLIRRHADLGNDLMPFALGFGVLVVVLLVAGRLADRERAADGEGGGDAKTWRTISVLVSALVVVAAVAAVVQTVRVGHSGSTAVWDYVTNL
ncbi:DUF2231 domain-containing protein [Umezawaea beigongshangensis]|uniref:DUF2231 domain-containing protein n=1 Tax=Umezawaea beigongshangensis TaxID=2780383 RepID=UPI0018F15342|nr:DUF2231 domain-containing protein [Umezawaea beigongshangensis]